MNIFFIIALVIILLCIYNNTIEPFTYSCPKLCNCNKPCSCHKKCKCGSKKCKPVYKCIINSHLRRKCTWISPCYN